ncbi:MAG: hypothetical protein KF887_19055 [Paracoccaceae bacterium]|nr:MAG: hypothetical protein KF887_19055 [Paracoccaceae bacterium]
MNIRFAPAALLGALALSACEGGLTPYVENPNTVIATARDTGRDNISLRNGGFAIAYDPDGCQNWIADDGVEGYSTPRYDPVSGLPVCNNHFPPGAVVKDYQTRDAGIRDYVPGTSRR